MNSISDVLHVRIQHYLGLRDYTSTSSFDSSLPTPRLLRTEIIGDPEAIHVLKNVFFPFPLMWPAVSQPISATYQAFVNKELRFTLSNILCNILLTLKSENSLILG